MGRDDDDDERSKKKHPNEVDREVGRRIKLRRQELGLNQQGLAEQIGVSYQQVQKYENGTDRIGASRLYAISVALGCSIAEFFERDPAHLRETGSQYEASYDAARLLATEDGRRLVQNYLRIDDHSVRRKLVELTGALASSGRRAGIVKRVRRKPIL